ncbi:hypothetical protein BDW42DRAFT_154655 [Aspergillus taichungensis]|uniref:Secreted protein n=1 Tax=Aspergillus taichungensis TaxID=482145 RepID=A0A2J5HL01_9EURO|nr:hypothetical protein BDW42DRAFT_154655 [Aspergillus taichungensis]
MGFHPHSVGWWDRFSLCVFTCSAQPACIGLSWARPESPTQFVWSLEGLVRTLTSLLSTHRPYTLPTLDFPSTRLKNVLLPCDRLRLKSTGFLSSHSPHLVLLV